MPSHRRTTLALTALALAAALVGCTAPDTVTAGARPNRPTSTAIASQSPVTDPAKLVVPLDSLPSWSPAKALGNGVFERRMTGSDGSYTWQILDSDNSPIEKYAPTDTVAWGSPSTYTEVPGVLVFRGNHARTAPTYGTAEIAKKKLEIVWTQEIGEIRGDNSYWPGAGWTGQPLLVHWPEATRKAMGLSAEFADDSDFTEVIYPVFEGKIYRLDLATGKQTKPPIESGWGFKGTGSIDPRGYPLLYTGQGLNDTNGNIGPWRYRIFDLIQNKEVSGWSGSDPAAPRQDWGAFDSSALVNRQTDTLIEPAENGLVYKVKLNAAFDPAAKTVSVNPQIVKMTFTTPVSEKHGIESSAVAYRNLMYATDNDGNLICWDANSLQVLWARALGDDSDATLTLDETTEGVFLYTGNEIDKRGKAGKDMITNLRKINALTGEQVWQYDIPALYNEGVNGGLMATPLLGKGEISDMVIFNVAKTTSQDEGTMVALDKLTGAPIWTRHMGRYSWSSPVSITGTDGHQYGIVCDSGGTMHLFDPNTGTDLATISLGKNTEASPSVYGNMIVVASYAKKIWGVRVS